MAPQSPSHAPASLYCVDHPGHRSPLNERDSAFGMAISDRHRASQGERQSNSLRCDFRRISEASILDFVQSLTYGGHPIGSTWKTGGKDFGLVAFVCLSDMDAGQQRPGSRLFHLKLWPEGRGHLQPVADADWTSRRLRPREFAHRVRLNWRTNAATPLACGTNTAMARDRADGQFGCRTASQCAGEEQHHHHHHGPCHRHDDTVFDKTKEIKWLWPRVTKAGVLDGTPKDPERVSFRVPLRKGHGRPFAWVTWSGSGNGRW